MKRSIRLRLCQSPSDLFSKARPQRTRAALGGALLLGALLLGMLMALGGCGWDPFDPRLEPTPIVEPSSKGCGTVALLNDDFEEDVAATPEGTALGPFLVVSNRRGAVARSGGDLVLSFPADINTDSYAEVKSSHHYDLRESALSIEVKILPKPPGIARFEVGTTWRGGAGFRTEGGQLKGYWYVRTDPNADLSVVTWVAPFEPAVNGFWRLRETGGVLHWEVSGDGEQWQTVVERDASKLFRMEQLQLRLRASANGNLGGEMRLAKLTGEAKTTQPCSVETLKDDFDDGLRHRLWGSEDDGRTTLLEVDGKLTVGLRTPPPHATKDSSQFAHGYRSRYVYDLRGQELLAEVVAVADPPAKTYMLLSSAAGPTTSLGFIIDESGKLNATLRRPGEAKSNILTAIPHDPVAHRWWRVREESEQLFWEVSADGSTWVDFAAGQLTPETDIDALQIRLGGINNKAEDAAIIQFDNLNLPPSF